MTSNLIPDEETPEQAFEKARTAYPPVPKSCGKKGHDTEWRNFKKKHADWATAAYDLFPAIELLKASDNRIRSRDPKAFLPRWPKFQTWINDRRWEEAAEI